MGCEGGEQHRLHMCSLSAAGDMATIRKLQTKPTVECGNCGAKANDPANVCDPVELPDIAWLGDGADVKLEREK
ncbi:hypothetical protein GURASL_35210 [Geotalea uraniireducens]|uniref:Uncharacterized protein n=2 Tax=Geotalea uraniireducens TaxID=351604 RepID=A0ABM8EQ54_9BACT|nr:hypothetical protein GURASL_35210 [Geotalea uraniireducens]